MRARTKLNRAYFVGSVSLAALVGWATISWTYFGLALAVLLALNVAAGEIRPKRRRRR